MSEDKPTLTERKALPHLTWMQYLKELEREIKSEENIAKMYWWLHDNRHTDITLDDMAKQMSEIEKQAISNLCIEKARELHKLIVSWNYVHDQEKVLEILDEISIPEGKALRCHLVNKFCNEIGDNSYLYVNGIDEPEDEAKISLINEIWENITVKPSHMALWQTYLLMTAIHVMPFFWHGATRKRTFILSPNDLKSIKELDGIYTSNLSDDDLMPKVSFTQWDEKTGSGVVSNTYWTEWGGLIKEHIFIGIKNNRITNYSLPCREVLIRHNSHTCY